MSTPDRRFSYLVVHVAFAAVLALILVYLYGLLFQLPYLGFDWSTDDGAITRFFVPHTALKLDDELVRIDSLSYAQFEANLRQPLFDYAARPGAVLHLTVRRGEKLLPVDWTLPGFSTSELADRLSSQWWLAVIFWLAGAAVALLVRPCDERWRLLAGFNFSTAAWLMASTLAHFHLWDSALLLRASMWLAIPVYWRVPWNVPDAMVRLPRRVWAGLYAAVVLLAGAEWFQRVPVSFFTLAFLLAVGGGLIITLIRLSLRPQQRHSIWVSLAGSVLAFVPALGLAVAAALTNMRQPATLALVALPLLPVTYLYAAYQRQLGNLELRVNRVVTLFVYLILFGTALIIVVSLLDSWVTVEGETTVFGFGAGVLAAGLAVATFSPFQRFIERRLLGMPVPPEELLPRFIDRIASSPGRMELGHQLRDEVLASLLVRESALLHYNLDAAADILYTTLPAAQLPVPAEARAALTAAAGRYLAPDDKTLAAFPWVRLVVPLQFGSQPTGVWLFGRRDPDDFYSQRDIQFLQTLAQQTSTALANIVQAERLQALYRSDIDRAEEERRRMARELHDQVLGRLALLKVGPGHTPESDALLEEVINRLRDTVAELRPALLEYGLGKALGSLATDDTQPPIVVELPASAARYDAGVELHLFRIVQQACQNARQHAQARLVRVSGRCDPEQIELLVQDDGVGLPVEARRGLAGMVAQRHFGLAGMVERAALVGAQVKFDSTPGNGTRVSILWRRRPD